jgi:hypothetical protein
MTSGNVPLRALALPAWAAVLLGVGAAAGLSLRCEDGRILLSEGGGPFQEVQLGDNEDAARLRALLAQTAVSDAPLDVTVQPVVVADGGQSPSWPKQDSSKAASPTNSKAPPPKNSKPMAQPKTG